MDANDGMAPPAEPATEGPSGASKLLRNSGFILGSQIWFTLLSLFTTPYIVGKMGVDGYGVFALVLVLTGYLSYLDLGLGWALIKFVAEHDARREHDGLNKCVATALFVVIAGGLFGAALLAAFADTIVTKLLTVPPAMMREAKLALWIACASFVLTSATAALNAVLKGFHRFEITSGLQVIFGSTCILGSVWVLAAGFGLRHVVAVYALAAACGLVAHVLALRRVRPGLALVPWLDRAEFKRMFSFSLFTTFTKLGMLAIFQLDKLFVAALLPVAYVSYYTIPFSVAQKLNLVASNAATVLFPVASAQFSTNDLEAYKRVYHRTARVVFLLTAVPVVVLIAFGDDFLRVWLGPAFATEGTVPFALLAIAFGAVSIASVEAVSIEAAGKPRVTAVFIAGCGLLNLVLCPVLTARYGITGTAASLAISLVTLAVAIVVFFNKGLLRSTMRYAIRKNYVHCLPVVLAGAAAAVLVARREVMDLGTLIVTMTLVTGTTCSLGVWSLLDREEQSRLKARVLARLT